MESGLNIHYSRGTFHITSWDPYYGLDSKPIHCFISLHTTGSRTSELSIHVGAHNNMWDSYATERRQSVTATQSCVVDTPTQSIGVFMCGRGRTGITMYTTFHS